MCRFLQPPMGGIVSLAFAEAVNDTSEEDGLLLRLDREKGRVCAIDYTEEDLAIAAKQRIEVR